MLNNTPRYDCAQAVSEVLAQWSQQGFLKSEGYDYVWLNSCFIGLYQSEKLPLFNISLVPAMTHRNVTGHVVETVEDGKIRLRLYRGYPKPLGTREERTIPPPEGLVVDVKYIE